MLKEKRTNGLLRYFSNEELNKLRNMKDIYSKSKILVVRLFEERVDKNGKPYINHLLRVSSKMTTRDGKVVALLHDVVEDIDGVTFADLKDIGIPSHIIEALKLVTKKECSKELTKKEKLERYNQEIAHIIKSKNRLAIELKKNDMSDNFDIRRLNQLDEEKQEWFIQKYGNNVVKLRKVMVRYK